MSILAWIVLGLVAGFIASKLVSRSGGSLVVDLVLGIVGAVVGGFLFNQFGSAGVTGLNLYSLLAINPATRPSTIHARIDMNASLASKGVRTARRCQIKAFAKTFVPTRLRVRMQKRRENFRPVQALLATAFSVACRCGPGRPRPASGPARDPGG